MLAERPDAELDGLHPDKQGSTIVLTWNIRGRNELAFYDVATGVITPGPVLPADLVGGFAFSRDGRQLALTNLGATTPADVWILDRRTQALRQLTFSPHAGVDLAALVRPELVTFRHTTVSNSAAGCTDRQDRLAPDATSSAFTAGRKDKNNPSSAATTRRCSRRASASSRPTR